MVDRFESSRELSMGVVIIEHVKASELPPQWVQRLRISPEQAVRVHIEPEETATAQEMVDFVTDDPAFGIWRDREDMADVEAYIRKLRAPRYNRDGSRNEDQGKWDAGR
jgi:hypothetical protein